MMKTLLVLCLCLSCIGCGANTAKAVNEALDVAQIVASTPGILSVKDATIATQAITGIQATIKAGAAGWSAAVETALMQLQSSLSADGSTKLAPYIAAVEAAVLVFAPAATAGFDLDHHPIDIAVARLQAAARVS